MSRDSIFENRVFIVFIGLRTTFRVRHLPMMLPYLDLPVAW